MVQPRAGQGSVQIALRLSPELRDRIRDMAEANGRSMNSEIVAILEAALEGGGPIAELPGAMGGGAASSIDDIAKVVVAKLAERPGVIPERDKERFFESYETAKRTETQNLRGFMDAATDILERKRDE